MKFPCLHWKAGRRSDNDARASTQTNPRNWVVSCYSFFAINIHRMKSDEVTLFDVVSIPCFIVPPFSPDMLKRLWSARFVSKRIETAVTSGNIVDTLSPYVVGIRLKMVLHQDDSETFQTRTVVDHNPLGDYGRFSTYYLHKRICCSSLCVAKARF